MFQTPDEQLYQICCTLDEISNISPPRPLILPTLSKQVTGELWMFQYNSIPLAHFNSQFVCLHVPLFRNIHTDVAGSQGGILYKKYCTVYNVHRRRIKTEAKAKVVSAVWGTECILFIATLAILHYRTILKNRMN